MDIGKEVSSSNVGYSAVFIDTCSRRSFLFIGKKVIWVHPFKTVLKIPWENFGISHHFWSLVAFLNCYLFLKRFSQFCHCDVLHRHLPCWLNNCFLHFHTSTMIPLLDKIEKKWKTGKKYVTENVKWWSTSVWVSKYSKESPSKLQSTFRTVELSRSIFRMSFCEVFIYGTTTIEDYQRV